MNEGLHPFHYGFGVSENFFPLSEFAIAWFGANDPEKLERILDEEVQKVLDGRYDEEEIPLFYDLVHRTQNEENRRFNLDDLRAMANEVYGSTKIVDHEAAMQVNKKGHIGTISQRDTLSMRITSRRHGTRQRAYNLTLYRPVISLGSLDSMATFHIEGGSPHQQKNLAKGTHWTKGLAQEEHFVRDLSKEVDAHFKGSSGLRISAKDVLKDYEGLFYAADYTRACALTTLHNLAKTGQTAKVKGLVMNPGDSIIMPFDFDNKPHLAIEAYLMLHYRPEGKRKADFEKRLFEIDQYLMGKNGTVTPLFHQLHTEGKVVKGAMVKDRKFSNYSWALLQAWESHFYLKGRRFSRFYGIEFPGTPHQTHSIVFEDMSKNLTVRLVYDESLGMPYAIYKVNGSEAKGIWRLGERSPMAMVNMAKDIHSRKNPYVKKWKERDHRTGEPVVCTIREPTLEIRRDASSRSTSSGMRGITPATIRHRYFENYQGKR